MATKTIAWDSGTGNATIQYSGQGDGQTTITSDANDLHIPRSMQIKVKTTDGSNIEKTVTISQTMKPYIDISNAVVTASNQTYSGSALTPAPTVTLNDTTIPSTGYDVVYSNNTNAGTATITVTGKGDYTGTATGTFTIDKAAPTYTAPTYNDWTYDGSSHYLVTTGSTNHGTIQFSTDGSTWSTTRPTQTNAGVYYTYWRLVGDSNHTDVSSTSIQTDVSKATPSYTAPTRRTGLTYNGSSQYLTTTGSTSHGTIYYSTDGINWYTSRRTGTNAGTYYNYWKLVGDANHTDISSTQLNNTTIAKASRSMSWTSYTTKMYEGTTYSFSASPGAGSGDGTITYSSINTSVARISGNGTVTAVSSGSCYLSAEISEGTNYLSSSTLCFLEVVEEKTEVYHDNLSSYNYSDTYKCLYLQIGTLVPGNKYNLNITGPNIYDTNIEFINSSGGYQTVATWSNNEDFTVPSSIASWADLSMTRLVIYYNSNADAVSAQSSGDVTIALYN